MYTSKTETSTCQLCGKSFPNKGELVSHEVTAHPNVGSVNDSNRATDRNRNSQGHEDELH